MVAQQAGRAGSRAVPWGVVLLAVGVLAYIVSSGVQDGATTKADMLLWGIAGGIGGGVAIIGLIALVVGLVRRARAAG